MRIDFKPYPGATYFTVQEHQRHFHKMEAYDPQVDLFTIERLFRTLLNITSVDYKFQLIQLSDKDKLRENFTYFCKDDPKTGMDFLLSSKEIQKGSLLDLTYSFPQVLESSWNFDIFFIDPNASLGVPADFGVAFTRMDFEGFLTPFSIKSFEGHRQEIYVLGRVLANLEDKGKEMLLRESNYKAAVLYQMIESCENLEPVTDKEKRSQSMIVAKCNPEFQNKIEKLGYKLGAESKDTITIANYPTHSKELIEMFADRVVEL